LKRNKIATLAQLAEHCFRKAGVPSSILGGGSKLKMPYNKSMKKSSGFTLIELLVVIAIIGILASVILVALDSARVKARDARRVEDLQQIQTALEEYYDQYGYYPAGSEASDRSEWVNNDGANANHPLGALKDAGYLSVVPYDPGKNDYLNYPAQTGCGAAQMYAYWSDGQHYLLGAVQEAKGTSGCTETGSWNGPAETDYTYQYYIRQGV
jgi:general secretion pathway protein G